MLPVPGSILLRPAVLPWSPRAAPLGPLLLAKLVSFCEPSCCCRRCFWQLARWPRSSSRHAPPITGTQPLRRSSIGCGRPTAGNAPRDGNPLRRSFRRCIPSWWQDFWRCWPSAGWWHCRRCPEPTNRRNLGHVARFVHGFSAALPLIPVVSGFPDRYSGSAVSGNGSVRRLMDVAAGCRPPFLSPQ